MLKILNSAQIKEWDAFTIKNEPIASIDLMERACQAFTQWFTEQFDATKKIGIVCGTGNNGGDGLAIARMLHHLGFSVQVWIAKGAVLESADFKVNKERLIGKLKTVELSGTIAGNQFGACDLLIDGVFGSGLSRPVEGFYAQVVKAINDSPATRVCIDIPSGMFADQVTNTSCVKADFTVTFQRPKLGFLLPENADRVGELVVVNIGLSSKFLKEVDCDYYMIDRKSIRKRIKSRTKFQHKGDFGKGLLVAGSYGKVGASVLAGRAAMRSGIGLLTIHVPRKGYEIIQTSVPEAMAQVDNADEFFTGTESVSEFSAIGLGPGLGTEKPTIEGVRELLEKADNKPMVIDADGLNIISANRELLHLIPKGSILTPHPGEFRRLAGDWVNDFEKLEKGKQLAKQIEGVVVLKGAYSAIFNYNGRVYFNPTGNPGMATGGSGDVLTGILTALLAQGYTAFDAAVVGVYIHGAAGDLAAFEKGLHGLIASDIIDNIPSVFRQFQA
ncbi:MAG: NAD(P)H-hydrate dehydratase [Cyclobacteriaceae bacterium]|nr:NAD(P)H-hydrate dehydratase [Cyclobacteriaceae bacterium]